MNKLQHPPHNYIKQTKFGSVGLITKPVNYSNPIPLAGNKL